MIICVVFMSDHRAEKEFIIIIALDIAADSFISRDYIKNKSIDKRQSHDNRDKAIKTIRNIAAVR